MSNSTSVIDVPRGAGDKDLFGISRYEAGLVSFLRNAESPLTVAVQGEWGSGKTSLLNTVHRQLCEDEQAPYLGIWLNTWEYALMKDSKEALVSIIGALLNNVLVTGEKYVDAGKARKIREGFSRFASAALLPAAKLAANVALSGAGDAVHNVAKALSNEQQVTVGTLRGQLEESVKEIVEKTNRRGFLFFVDDLDRIDPPVAVQILELLKNIFDIPNCIFVLAVDYDVVIKGLRPKFGELTPQNEREFRSFFDKIIQMPFSMPVGSYQSGEFLKEKLQQIGYLTSADKNNEVLEHLTDFTSLTIGTNPRSIKRLLNALSLIMCIHQAMENDEEQQLSGVEDRIINYALVAIQIAYPIIYQTLVKYPDFKLWDENIVRAMNLKPLTAEEKEALSRVEEFDEEWEQVLYGICQFDPWMKKRSIYVSRVLNKIAVLATKEDEGESVGDTVSALTQISAVTNLEAFDKPVESIHKSPFLKGIRWRTKERIRESLAAKGIKITEQGKRVQAVARIRATDTNTGVAGTIDFSVNPTGKGIVLRVGCGAWIEHPPKNFDQAMKEFGLTEQSNALESLAGQLKELGAKYSYVVPQDMVIQPHKKWPGMHVWNVFTCTRPEAKDFNEDQTVTVVANALETLIEMLVILKNAEKISRERAKSA